MTGAYRAFGYFGLASIFGALLYGFRYDPAAPAGNYLLNILAYLAWAAVHLAMTRAGFKRAVFGTPEGSLFERQVYVLVAVSTWLALVGFHLPVPGPAVELPGAVRFAACVGFVLSVLAFFEGVTFSALDSLLGVPGSELSHTHGEETPLLTEGQYAGVRHPMYRAAIFAGVSSLFLHANAAQLLWVLLVGGTFVAFIPVEEAQLVASRGDAYRAYMEKTPWRLLRGVW
ncbi:MAG: hypothetical protein KatS3mg076_3222 [Candidatus Binatia bacterium]|nr:MAG: hypothetical protein KatS3mg076_3222 [Candidatus Binatia bacterium]